MANVYVLGCIDTNGNEVKTLNVALPPGVELNFVTISEKKCSLPDEKKAKIIRQSSPPPPAAVHSGTFAPQMPFYSHRPGGYYPHYQPYPITAPAPYHQPQAMFLQQESVAESLNSIISPPQPVVEEKPAAATPKSVENKKSFKKKEKARPPKPAAPKKQEELLPEVFTGDRSPIPFGDDVDDNQQVPCSPLVEKEFKRKNGKKPFSYAKAAASFLPDPSSVPKEPKIKPPISSSFQHQKKNNDIQKKKYAKKPSLSSVFTKGPVVLDDGYEPFSRDYPQRGNHNLFQFAIPSRYKNSELAKNFPQTFKFRLIALAVGHSTMQHIQSFWQQREEGKYPIDYPRSAFYFAAVYNFRKVILPNGDYINICHIYNRFFDTLRNKCMYGPDDCKFYHICMMCGNDDHGAFQRKEEDKTYICEEHCKLVAERCDMKERGYTDEFFDNEIHKLDDEYEEECERISSGITLPKTVYAKPYEKKMKNGDSCLVLSTIPINDDTTIDEAVFPPLNNSKSPQRKKKKNNKKNAHSAPSSPVVQQENNNSQSAE